jgi:cell division protein ZapA (FtsZ GTPase activity inhibitor)
MWIVEVNVLGRRFTYQTHDHAKKLRDTQRTVQSRLAHLRHARTAA